MALNSGHADVGGVAVRLQPETCPRLVLRAVSQHRLQLMEIRYGLSPVLASPVLPRWADAFTVSIRLRAETSVICIGGKSHRLSASTGDARMMYIPMIDYVDFESPRHSLEILLTRDFLDELAEDLGARRISRIGTGPSVTSDPRLPLFGNLVLPFIENPRAIDPLWADQFMWGFSTYVCATHGDLIAPRPKAGALCRWQERLAKDVMNTMLVEGIRLTELASMCGLRTSQFAHAFKHSTGISPYQWLVKRRVEHAQEKIKRGVSLVDTALACGFSDQSHLIRVFKRNLGMTPRVWQRLQQP